MTNANWADVYDRCERTDTVKQYQECDVEHQGFDGVCIVFVNGWSETYKDVSDAIRALKGPMPEAH